MKAVRRQVKDGVRLPLVLEDGEYGKDIDGVWYGRPPGILSAGSFAKHDVTEHPDGTITVSPSILIMDGRSEWHGYLERGEWRQV